MLKKINRFRAQDFLNKSPEISKRTDFFTVKGFRSDKNNRFSVVLSKKNINSAVLRNKLKRLIFDLLKPYLDVSPYRDYIIIPSPKIKKDFKSELITLEVKKLMGEIY